MQRELFKAVKLFGGFIPLYFFKEAIDGNNPLLLTQNLAYIMGAVVAGCYSSTSMMQWITKGDNVDILSFKFFCAGKLREIILAFLSFDFMSLKNECMTIHNIWNGTNLCFRQGLFFEYPFPPLHCLEIQNKELSDFKVND